MLDLMADLFDSKCLGGANKILTASSTHPCALVRRRWSGAWGRDCWLRGLRSDGRSCFRWRGRWRRSRQVTTSNHVVEYHPSRKPYYDADDSAQNRASDATLPPQQRAQKPSQQEAGAAEQQRDSNQTERIVQNADIGHRWLPLLPPTPMPRCAAAGAGRGAEIVGFARRCRLIDFARRFRPSVVGCGFAR